MGDTESGSWGSSSLEGFAHRKEARRAARFLDLTHVETACGKVHVRPNAVQAVYSGYAGSTQCTWIDTEHSSFSVTESVEAVMEMLR